jgi:hypothetical protein
MRMKDILSLFWLFMSLGNMIQAQSIATAEQMNVLFIGVDNPVNISLGKIPEKDLDITLSQGKIEKVQGRANIYNVRVTTIGDMTITVSHKGKVMGKHQFRVKRVPLPQARLPLYERSNQLTAKTLQNVTGLVTVLENFDFDIKCSITSFSCIYKAADCKQTIIKNEGTLFNAQLLDIIKKAKVGDMFMFQDIKAQCPDDTTVRQLNELFVVVKQQ